ncbi:hypothetical protein KIN20_013064 [Parelaphostrongylus tenuis]|uniref:Uncharacterized protein n=1 Tax=Parelaphostrongylus tenuis TaxID=148309 RepID=A0AAD5QNJ2_PARTN|nr:hypothetical protein KIN20_013064 [Parelaphostrongylus tenuis]
MLLGGDSTSHCTNLAGCYQKQRCPRFYGLFQVLERIIPIELQKILLLINNLTVSPSNMSDLINIENCVFAKSVVIFSTEKNS